ncbi:MAG: response regulator [Acidobacteriota bacterium]
MLNPRLRAVQAVRLCASISGSPMRPKLSETDQVSPPVPVPSKLRILLVEDNAVNRTVAARMLTRLGLTPDTCTNGYEAVERATANTYDIILMDVHMPKMDGLEATHRIRALQRSERTTRIVALTANTTDETRDACKAAGMDGFLAKPVTIDELAITLAQLFPPVTDR